MRQADQILISFNYVPSTFTPDVAHLLCLSHFCKDKSIGKTWIDTFIDNLFASEYGLQIAKDWEKVRKRIKIKAGIIGCLWGADFLEGSNMQIAKAILQGEKGNRSSFAEYMGLGRKEPYAKWIYDYVK